MAGSPRILKLNHALPVGSELSCTTCYGSEIRGNVITSDEYLKALALQSGTEDQKRLHIVNLSHVSQLDIVKSPQDSSALILPPIDLDKVKKRHEFQVKHRNEELKKIGENVTPEAQKLFNAISKIYSDTHWEDGDIVVLQDMRISPPYIKCQGNNKDLEKRLQQTVNRFHEEKLA